MAFSRLADSVWQVLRRDRNLVRRQPGVVQAQHVGGCHASLAQRRRKQVRRVVLGRAQQQLRLRIAQHDLQINVSVSSRSSIINQSPRVPVQGMLHIFMQCMAYTSGVVGGSLFI